MRMKMIVAISIVLLTGCGGNANPGSAKIGGTINGVSGTALLVNNGTDTIAVDANGGFTFDQLVPAGSPYNVTLFPATAGMICTINNGAGTVDSQADDVKGIAVNCQGTPSFGSPGFNLGVTVSGLAAGNTITFLDSGSSPLVATSNGLVVFPYLLDAGPPSTPPPGSLLYSVTIANNPAGQTCTLGSNATPVGSFVTSENFVNVTATCK
jgi:hypothetical protein